MNNKSDHGSHLDKLTAAIWSEYTGYSFDAQTVKVLCGMREVLERDALVRSLMHKSEEDADG